MTNYFLIFALFCSMSVFQGCANSASIERRNKAIIKEMFKRIESPNLDLEYVERTHAKSYRQFVDGETLDYDGYVAHHKKLKESVSSIKIDFDHVVASGNKVATVHRAHAMKKDGSFIKVKVNALFEFDASGKLILCDELTHLIEGDDADRDLGSRK